VRVHLLLDATAILAYCQGSVDVGETISEVTDNGYEFAVLAVSLVEAGIQLQPDQMPMLDMLIRHPVCDPVPLTSDAGWRWDIKAARLYGSYERGQVGTVAVAEQAYILTAAPEAYKNLPTIAI
jgi:hypothetical protein